jgi:hypothetical protein
MPGRPCLSCLGCQICLSRACAPSHLNSPTAPVRRRFIASFFSFSSSGPCSLGPRSVPSHPLPPITADDPPIPPPPMGVLTVRRGSLQKIARNVCNLATLVRTNPSLAQRMHELHLDTANLVSSAALLHIALARKHWTRARTVQTVRTRVASEGGGVTASASPTHPPSKRASAARTSRSAERVHQIKVQGSPRSYCAWMPFSGRAITAPELKQCSIVTKQKKKRARKKQKQQHLLSSSPPPPHTPRPSLCIACMYSFPTCQTDLLSAGITTLSSALHGSLNLPSHISHIA